MSTKIKRAMSVDELLKKRFNLMDFEGDFLELMGEPECAGVWFIWGGSFNGKTRFTLSLCKYLAGFYKTAYNTLEQRAKRSFQLAIDEMHMISVANNFMILDGESIADLKIRLRKKKSPRIIVIDSIQYAKIKKAEWDEMVDEFGHSKLFIVISHATGKNPRGSLAESIRYDADVKIHVEGFVAFAESRFGGGKPYVIWQEGALKHWKQIPQQ